ncbi:MAG: ABC transporter substrate-binding protein, partial [Promethearchaeota archaeon]
MKTITRKYILLAFLTILTVFPVISVAVLANIPKTAQAERVSFVVGEGGTGAMLDDWDPAIATTGNFGSLEPLVWNNWEDRQAYPMLATSWTLHPRPDEGNNTGGVAAISFNLRQGVEFMDGLKWNASVLKWNYDRMHYITQQNIQPHKKWQGNWWFDPASVDHRFTPSWNLTWGLSDPFGNGKVPIINETIIVSEYVVNFTLNKYAVTPQRFGGLGMISSKEYAAFATDVIRGYSGQGVDHCVGTGAYQFVYADNVVTNTQYSIKNENYWNKDYLEAQGLFVVDDKYLRWYATPEARTTALLAGDIDSSGWQAQNKLTDMAALEASSYHTLFPTEFDPSYTTVQFSARENNDKPVAYLGGLTLRQYWPTWAAANGIPGVPLAQGVNHSLRRAISYAYNYPNYIDVQYADIGAIRCDSPLGTECVWNDGTVPYYEYNVTRAREVLLKDPYYLAKAAARGLDVSSTTTEWNGIAGTNPINTLTYLDGGTPHKLATLEKALNDLGFAMNSTISTQLDTQWMHTKKAMQFDMFSYIWPTDPLYPFDWMGVGMNLLYNSYAVAIPALFNFAMMQNSTIDTLMADIPFAGTAAQPLYNELTAMLLREANHLYIAQAQRGVVVNSGWNVTQTALAQGGGRGVRAEQLGGARLTAAPPAPPEIPGYPALVL